MQINRKSSKFNTSLFYLHKNFYTLNMKKWNLLINRGLSKGGK